MVPALLLRLVRAMLCETRSAAVSALLGATGSGAGFMPGNGSDPKN